MVDPKSILPPRHTHGLAVRGHMHPLYRVLNNIKARCDIPSATNYEYYGGRGIGVCDEWRLDPRQFIAWAEANGWQAGLEVDRKNADGDYSPDNCQITTHRENSQRTRRIHTTPEQVRRVRELLHSGVGVQAASTAAGVSYMVAWHIKNSPGVWSNVS